MEVVIRQVVQDYIKSHANMNKGKEIFGWLVGSEDKKKGKLFVECAISSHRYMTQNVIAAEPDLTETGIISSVLPAGLGIIGMYHSHPVNVFHSSTDDRTLVQLTTLYPQALSIVTNGEVLTGYQLIKGKGSTGVETEFKTSKNVKNDFKEVTFEFQGELSTHLATLPVNDIVAAIVKKANTKLEDSDFTAEIKKSAKKKDHSVEISLDKVYPVGTEEKQSENHDSGLKFSFKTVLDVSEALLGDRDALQQRITHPLRTSILTQLILLKVIKEEKIIIIPERQNIDFQDIPLHAYLDPDNADTPMHHFIEDMKIREEILMKIN